MVPFSPPRFRALERRLPPHRAFCLVLALIGLTLLARCAAPFRAGPLPTLVPTLSILIPPTTTSQPLTATLAAITQTPTLPPPPTETLVPTGTDMPLPSRTPTVGPSPTVTRTGTSTRIPTATRIPSRTPTITLTPTVTNTPTPPAPVLELVRPGLLSKIVSPIQTEMQVVTGGDNQVTIELIGEDGRVISRQVIDYGPPARRRFWMSPSLPFEIDAAAETARLQVLTRDEVGRLQALSSVDVILLQMGRSEIYPPAITQEPYLIRRPRTDDVITGGVLVVQGLVRPLNDSPLWIELINEAGAAIVTKQIIVPPPSGPLSHTPFQVEIPYRVTEPTSVRLTVRQEGSRIPGTVALVSRLITLDP